MHMNSADAFRAFCDSLYAPASTMQAFLPVLIWLHKSCVPANTYQQRLTLMWQGLDTGCTMHPADGSITVVSFRTLKQISYPPDSLMRLHQSGVIAAKPLRDSGRLLPQDVTPSYVTQNSSTLGVSAAAPPVPNAFLRLNTRLCPHAAAHVANTLIPQLLQNTEVCVHMSCA